MPRIGEQADDSFSAGTVRPIEGPVAVVLEPTATLFVGVGSPYLPPGRTQVRLHADGKLQADTFDIDGMRSDATTVSAEAAQALVRETAAIIAGLADKPRWRREDDEPVYLMEVRFMGEASCRVVVTRRQLAGCDGLSRIVGELARFCETCWSGQHVL